MKTDGCRQSRIAALPAPLAGESIEIQYYRPGATIDVLVAQPRERLKVDSGTLVEIGPGDVTSQCSMQFTLGRGQRRAAKIRVQPGWTIDSVESLETNRPLNWELDEGTPQHTDLNIRFDAAIASDRPARVVVRGHKPLPPAAGFEGRQIEMLALRFISARNAANQRSSGRGFRTALDRVGRPESIGSAEAQTRGI